MAQYRIELNKVRPTQADFEQTLQSAYLAKLRPECLCVGEEGLPMYIAQINNRFWLKRMPGTGRKHAVGCASWEMPEEFSGRSDLVGSALHYKEDEVALRLGFALSHRGKSDGDAMEKSNKDKPTAKSTGDNARLTIRSLLHYLWDEAGLTSWTGSNKPRDWAFVYDCLSMAASRKTVKHAELQRYLYIPRPFSEKQQRDIDAERRQRFARIAGVDAKKVHHLLLMLGAVDPMKQIGADWRVTFKNMPNCPFVIKGELHDQMLRHLGREMRMVNALSPGHLVMMGTFCVEAEGTAVFEEVSLMYVNENWIPYENIYDRELLDKLIKDNRSFLRLLRYNRPSTTPMPTLLLTDCGAAPVSIYVLEAESSISSVQVGAAAAASKYESIVWNVQVSGGLPELPAKSDGTRPVVPADEPLSQHPFEPLEAPHAASPVVEPVL